MSKKTRPRRQVAVGQLLRQAALDILADARRAIEEPSKSNAVRIHDFRKAMKRFRALLRLLAPALGEPGRQLRLQARDLARELAGTRDIQSALDAIRDITKEEPRNALSARTVKTINDRLAALKKSKERVQLAVEMKDRLVAWIGVASATVRDWPLDTLAFSSVADGLAAHYRRAKRMMPDKWSEAPAEEIHEFRQLVIVHRYQLEFIEPLHRKLIRKWAGAAQRLRGRLGRYQDLTLLEGLSAPGQPLAPWRVRLQQLVKQRQEQHLDAAAKLADRVFSGSRKGFRGKIDALWHEPAMRKAA